MRGIPEANTGNFSRKAMRACYPRKRRSVSMISETGAAA